MYSREIKGNTAKACAYNARVSTKTTKTVCKAVQGMDVAKAKKLLEDFIAQKRHIRGRYYPSISSELLELIKSAEKNAEFKNLDTKNMFIAHIASTKGTTMKRRRHKNKIGTRIKATHLEIILKERGIPGAEKKVLEKVPEKKEEKKEPVKAAPEKKEGEKKEPTAKPEAPKAEAKKEAEKEKKAEGIKEAVKEKVKAEVKKKEAAKKAVKEKPKDKEAVKKPAAPKAKK